MPFWIDDVDTFFNDFAEDVILTDANGNTSTIGVVWDDPYDRINFRTGAKIAINNTQCVCKSTDAAAITKECKITKDEIEYNIIGIQNEGKGVITLVLSRD